MGFNVSNNNEPISLGSINIGGTVADFSSYTGSPTKVELNNIYDIEVYDTDSDADLTESKIDETILAIIEEYDGEISKLEEQIASLKEKQKNTNSVSDKEYYGRLIQDLEKQINTTSEEKQSRINLYSMSVYSSSYVTALEEEIAKLEISKANCKDSAGIKSYVDKIETIKAEILQQALLKDMFYEMSTASTDYTSMIELSKDLYLKYLNDDSEIGMQKKVAYLQQYYSLLVSEMSNATGEELEKLQQEFNDMFDSTTLYEKYESMLSDYYTSPEAGETEWAKIETFVNHCTNLGVDVKELYKAKKESEREYERQLEQQRLYEYELSRPKDFWDHVDDFREMFAATAVTEFNSLISGIGDVFEGIADGGMFIFAAIGEGYMKSESSKVSMLGDEQLATEMSDASKDTYDWVEPLIEYQAVDSVNEWFYGTEFGKLINDASSVKYDSDYAQTIRGTGKVAAEITLAALTGGTAAAVLGAFEGIGDTAESVAINGDLKSDSNGMIYINGALTALSWYANGKLGSDFLAVAKEKALLQTQIKVALNNLKDKGIKEILTESLKSAISPVRNGKININAFINYISAGMMSADDFTPYFLPEDDPNHKNWPPSIEEIGVLAKNYGINLLLNVAEDMIRDSADAYAHSGEAMSKLFKSAKNAEEEIKIFNLLKEDEIADFIHGLDAGSINRILLKDGVIDSDTFNKIFKNLNDSNDISKLLKAVPTDRITDIMSKNPKDFAELINKTNISDWPSGVASELFKNLNSEKFDEMLESLNDDGVIKVFAELDKITNVDSNSLHKLFDKITNFESVNRFFEAGMIAAKDPNLYRGFFNKFREHSAKHSAAVRDYALELSNQAGLSSTSMAEIYYAGLYHDFGMKGGLYAKKDKTYKLVESIKKEDITFDDITSYATGEAGTEYKKLKQSIEKKLLSENPDLDDEIIKKMAQNNAIDIVMKSKYNIEDYSKLVASGITPTEALGNNSLLNQVYSFERAMKVRKNHPLNSALSILTSDVVPEGVDKEIVALLAMSHSKSTSGIQHIDNPAEWKDCIDRLEKALKELDPNAEFDSARLKRIIDNDPVKFDALKKEALCIRDGDAMSEIITVGNRMLMQTGEYTELTFTSVRADYNDIIPNKDYELDTFVDKVYDENGNYIEEITNSFSKTTHAGELNIKKFDSTYDGSNYYARVILKDPNAVPHCTFSAIDERIGEVLTYTNTTKREFVIELPKEALGADGKGTTLSKWYENTLATFKEAKKQSIIADLFDSDDELSDYFKKIVKVEDSSIWKEFSDKPLFKNLKEEYQKKIIDTFMDGVNDKSITVKECPDIDKINWLLSENLRIEYV